MEDAKITELVVKVVLASFGATGLIEFLKNFIKTKKTWVYSLIMPFFAVLCFVVCEFCPTSIIGSILTIGVVQLNYQVIVQGFQKVINASIEKTTGKNKNTMESTESVSTESTINISAQ